MEVKQMRNQVNDSGIPADRARHLQTETEEERERDGEGERIKWRHKKGDKETIQRREDGERRT